MRILLDAFELNSATNRVYVDSVEGLELPEIRTSRGNRSGQAGSYIAVQLFDARYITIKGRVFSSTTAEAAQKRAAIQAALPLHPSVIAMRFFSPDGNVYLIYCNVKDFKMPIERQLFSYDYKLELEASDPTIYDDTAGAALIATINKLIPGGMLFSSTTPQFGSTTYFSAGTPNATIDNPSIVTVYPVITITGKITNPVISNLTTGEVFSMAGYAVSSDSVTVIDMQAHTATLNGGNVFGYIPLDSGWISLVPGENELALDSDSSSDVSSAVMTWRPGMRGI